MIAPRALLAAAVATLALAGCTSAARTSATPTLIVPSNANVATRWWSDSAAKKGSAIDPDDPSAAAQKLHPSRTSYCSILSQTLAAGHSILPNATATDPALADASTAFVTELQHVAPAAVSSDWTVLAQAVTALVHPSPTTHLDGAAVGRAATAVAADAKTNCHLDLSSSASK